MSLPQVSVVIPLFGGADINAIQALPAICHAWLQQEVPCEVVIAVTAGTPVPALPDGGIHVVTAPRQLASPGPLRNLAVAAARASVLYLTDADVAPVGADFARRALALLNGRPVVQPWMYRLVNPAEVTPGPPFERLGQGRACHVVVDAGGKLVPVGNERFRWLSPDMMVAEPPPGIGSSGADEIGWRPFPFHWGGILVPRETFDEAGGYCARYTGWGCEDEDLITKLDGLTGTVRAWRVAAQQLGCLHFEHPRSHTLTHIRANQAIMAERLAAGVDAMIEEDRH
jgi:hypothetical protein